MYEILFLGLIPGTDIQITFAGWLCALAGIIAIYAGINAARRKLVLKARLVIAFFLATRRPLQA
jgi:hypothetical protein